MPLRESDFSQVEGPVPEGFRLYPNILSREWHDRLVEISQTPKLLHRREAAYDSRPFTDKKTPSLNTLPFPAWGEELAQVLRELGVTEDQPDHIWITAYKPGQGMPSHVDRKFYEKDIITCCLNAPGVLQLGIQSESPEEMMDVLAGVSPELVAEVVPEDAGVLTEVLLNPRDVYVLSGPARTTYAHGLKEEKPLTFRNNIIDTTKGRISVVLRTWWEN